MALPSLREELTLGDGSGARPSGAASPPIDSAQAYVDAVADAFRRAAGVGGQALERTYDLAGHRFRLRFANAALFERVTPALAHLATMPGPPTLDVCLFDSASLGTYLMTRLQERGVAPETLTLHRTVWSDVGRAALFEATDRADVIVLAFPLYVDALPFIVAKTLEMVAAHRAAQAAPKRQQFVALVNCGFPEAQQCEVAVAICHRFAREAGLEWAGGLALGGGEAIAGRPLQEAGGLVRNVRRALDQAAAALAADTPIPQAAIDLMAQPLVSRWLYVFMGGRFWRKRAQRFGARQHLRDAPFAQQR